MPLKVQLISPIEGTDFSPLFASDEAVNKMIEDDKYYIVTNAGNNNLFVGGGGINGAFRSNVAHKFGNDEVDCLNNQLQSYSCNDDGEAYPLNFSDDVVEKHRCLGMIYAVGPDESGSELDITKSNEFLFKLKRTGMEIAKCIALKYNDRTKIRTLRMPIISGAIFKPSAITLCSTKGTQSIVKNDTHISVIIFTELLQGILTGLSKTSHNLEVLEFYHDPFFNKVHDLKEFVSSQKLDIEFDF